MDNTRWTLLVVDDDERSRRLLRTQLESEGYSVIDAEDGRDALRKVDSERPHLVLLDVMMPALDGFEVLATIRSSSPTTPVIMVSALDDRDSKLRGLKAGANDFLSKPVDRAELSLRVRNLLMLKKYSDALARQAKELASVNRELDLFAARVAHDLHGPVFHMLGFARVIHDRSAGRLGAEESGYLQRIISAGERAHRMTRDLLAFARMGEQPIQLATVDLNAVVGAAREAVAPEADGRLVSWQVASLPSVRGNASLLEQVFVNLLSNALKYARGRDPACIDIDCRHDPLDGYVVSVHDNGVGFDPASAERLFVPFQRLHSRDEFPGNGMGLANVRRIIERHGGSVRAESRPGLGAVFTVTFPGP